MSVDVHPNPGPATKCPCALSRLYSQRHQSMSKLSAQHKLGRGGVRAKCFRLLITAQNRRSSGWACNSCSTPPQIPSLPPTSTPSLDQTSDDSTFNVLQLNVNGISNKGVVNGEQQSQVSVIQESKLTSKSKNPRIQNYITVRKDRPHGHGGGLLIFIHRSVTFSKQPSSAELLSDSHIEELSIRAEIWNTKWIVSNIYIPPFCCFYYV